jgi:hypothetical protein
MDVVHVLHAGVHVGGCRHVCECVCTYVRVRGLRACAQRDCVCEFFCVFAEDHMVRDINAGRYANSTSLVLVTHGLALRIFLMRWFHWTVDQFLGVYNPPNAEVSMGTILAPCHGVCSATIAS